MEHECKIQTALQIALDERNQKSIDILLKYMANIKLDCARNFMAIIDELIDYPNFKVFLAEMLF